MSAEDFLRRLYETLRHGDEGHQDWLFAKIMEHQDALENMLRDGKEAQRQLQAFDDYVGAFDRDREGES